MAVCPLIARRRTFRDHPGAGSPRRSRDIDLLVHRLAGVDTTRIGCSKMRPQIYGADDRTHMTETGLGART